MPNYKNLARCPYFLAENKRSITCEDVIRRFSSEDRKNKYTNKHCNNEWEACSYASDLNKLYQELDEARPELRTEILLRHNNNALRTELNKVKSLLGRAEKKIVELENGEQK